VWAAARLAGMSAATIQWPATVGARVTWNIPEYWRAGTSDDDKLLRAVSTAGLLAEMERDLPVYPRRLEIEDDELRARYAQWLLERKRPQLMLLHLIALDHVQHEKGPFSAESLVVLERLDGLVGALRDTAERLAPGRAWVAVVSDHGFAKTTAQLYLFSLLRGAALFTVDGGRITDWKAVPWNAGGSAAILLKEASDTATSAKVRELLDQLAQDPANGIDRVLDASALHQRGGYPPAAFLVGLKPGWETGSSLTGPVLSRIKP